VRQKPPSKPRTPGRTAPHLAVSLRVPGARQFNCTFTAWHPETGGANRSEPERKRPGSSLVREDACGDRCEQPDVAPAAGVQGLGRAADGPRAAQGRDTGQDVAAHHGLVKMIPQWERDNRTPRQRHRLLYPRPPRGDGR